MFEDSKDVIIINFKELVYIILLFLLFLVVVGLYLFIFIINVGTL